MPESTKVQGIGAYANLCLTVIAGCLMYLCYRTTTTDAHPTKVEIVRIASKLDTPMPCKLMFKKKSTYSTQWTDEGRLGVQLAGGEFMRVEIVGVASDIQNPLPITTKHGKNGGLFGGTPSNDEAIAVRLVGGEKPKGRMQVEIVAVASDIQNPLPITTKYGKISDLAGASFLNDDKAIAVRLVGIEKKIYGKQWDAIPVEGTLPGWPIEVRVAP